MDPIIGSVHQRPLLITANYCCYNVMTPNLQLRSLLLTGILPELSSSMLDTTPISLVQMTQRSLRRPLSVTQYADCPTTTVHRFLQKTLHCYKGSLQLDLLYYLGFLPALIPLQLEPQPFNEALDFVHPSRQKVSSDALVIVCPTKLSLFSGLPVELLLPSVPVSSSISLGHDNVIRYQRCLFDCY